MQVKPASAPCATAFAASVTRTEYDSGLYVMRPAVPATAPAADGVALELSLVLACSSAAAVSPSARHDTHRSKLYA